MKLGVYSFGDIHPNPVTHEKVSPGQRMVDLLRRSSCCWPSTPGTVTCSGQFRPPLDKAVILPRPYEKPGVGEHLRTSIAIGGNPESSVRAGILGLPINYAIIGGEPARFAPLVGYRRAFEQTERPGAAAEVAVSDGIHHRRWQGDRPVLSLLD